MLMRHHRTLLRYASSTIYNHNKAAGQRYLSSSASSVGFLGLGNMGLPMAINLAKSKHVIAFDLNENAISNAHEHGITTVESIERVAQESAATIVTMLPGDAAVNSVLKQILSKLPEHSTVIDCSTVSPKTSRYWNDRLAAEGHLFVDAPVSGGVAGARNATLTFMVGTDEETLQERLSPILECMGQRVIACGGPGAGAAVKLCNNLALAAQMVGICEAMNLGEALGVDPIVLANAMNTSTAKSWSCEVNNPHPSVASFTNSPASHNYAGGFATRLMLKDLGLAVSAGSQENVALPLANSCKEIYQLAEAHGLGNKDFGVILQFLKGK